MPFTLPLQSKAPDFSLRGTDGKTYTLESFSHSPILVIFFTCNHCPYVLASDETTRKTVLKFKDRGVAFVAINSNTPELYEEDSFAHMVERMKTHKFPWLYLVDEDQNTARAYGALRTPHFYVFDTQRQLVYCGRAIEDPMHSEQAARNDLEEAIKDTLEGKRVSMPLTNPVGCTVKWKNHDAHWIPDDACDLVQKKKNN
jgi:peroxiredoxin